MNFELIMLMTGLALFAWWLNYVMGTPLADRGKVDTGAMLFFIPLYLAARRLHMHAMLAGILSEQDDELNLTTDPFLKSQLTADHKAAIYLKGRELFTWEKMLLCPVCFHWWLTLVVGLVLLIFDGLNVRADFFLAAFLYLVNHFLIRKILL